MFDLILDEQAAKRLAKINEPYHALIVKEFQALKQEYFPRGKNCKRLNTKTKHVYRLRIGVYRTIYHVSHEKKRITVLRVFHRGEGYDLAGL